MSSAEGCRQERLFWAEGGLQILPSLADITVICPWEAFSHLELHELAQFGII